MVVDLPTPGEPVMPTRIALAGVGQQRLHQIARRRLVVAAPALDQRDRPRQRRAASGAEVFGEGLDVDAGAVSHAFGLDAVTPAADMHLSNALASKISEQSSSGAERIETLGQIVRDRSLR